VQAKEWHFALFAQPQQDFGSAFGRFESSVQGFDDHFEVDLVICVGFDLVKREEGFLLKALDKRF
jgi:hypothetical protein